MANTPTHVERHPGLYTPLTEAELLTVSELIRGRVKVADVNQVYEALFKHFHASKDK